MTTMTNSTATPAEVREWARENGYEIGERGRISSEIAMAFNKAQGRGRKARKFVSGENTEASPLSVTGVRRGTRNGEQVFEVEVAGVLTFKVP